MFRNMVTSLFKYERIRTTDAKAKELRRWADHLVTLAKRGDLHARRQALSIVREKAVVHKLFEEVQEKFGKRKGGYTRVIKLGHRPGDAAKIAMIELVQEEAAAKKKKAAPKPKKTAEAPAPTATAVTETVSEEASEEASEEVPEAASEADDAAEGAISAAEEETPPPAEEASEKEASPSADAVADAVAEETSADKDTASDDAEPAKKEE
jgi:large subunit ribosomal protein L17